MPDASINFHWAIDMRFELGKVDEKTLKRFYDLAEKLGVSCEEPVIDGDNILIVCPEELNADVTESVFRKSFLNEWFKKYERLLKILGG